MARRGRNPHEVKPGDTLREDGKPKGTALPTVHRDVTVLKPADAPPEVGGAPEVVITDLDMLYEVAKTHASYATLAKIFGVSKQGIWMKYKDIVEKARAEAKKNLLAAQFKSAIDDRNPTMQIWLGKQYLGQRDTSRVEQQQLDANGKPAAAKATVVQATLYVPDNGRDPLARVPQLEAEVLDAG